MAVAGSGVTASVLAHRLRDVPDPAREFSGRYGTGSDALEVGQRWRERPSGAPSTG